jgi:beta-glucanase (GH16 family)
MTKAGMTIADTAQAGLKAAGASAPPMRRLVLLAALGALGSLAACGGGGGDGPGAASPPPPVAAPVPAPPSPPAASPPAAPSPPPAAAGPAPAGYQLVWADEFDTPGLPDPSRWVYDTERNRLGWYNNERQYYSAARTQNSVVEGGRLRITARRESLSSLPDWGGQAYSSARLITRGKAAWTYGFFEIRARMPCGRGTWPAIWTLGVGGPGGTVWPDDGEIDILEHVGSNPEEILGTLHTRARLNNGSRTALPSACTAFNDYQMHWTADEITIAVNGLVYHRFANPRTGRAAWPFDAPQYLLLNIAVGGTLGGAVDDTIFPRTMEVEHVRVWQRP